MADLSFSLSGFLFFGGVFFGLVIFFSQAFEYLIPPAIYFYFL